MMTSCCALCSDALRDDTNALAAWRTMCGFQSQYQAILALHVDMMPPCVCDTLATLEHAGYLVSTEGDKTHLLISCLGCYDGDLWIYCADGDTHYPD